MSTRIDGVLGEQAVEFGGGDTRRGPHEVGQLGGEDAVVVDREVSDGVVRADAGQPQRGVLLLAGVGDQRDRLADVGDHAAGFGEAAVESDVDRAAQVSGGEVVDAAGIHHAHAIVERLADLRRAQCGNLAGLVEQRVDPLVHRRVDGEVRRGRRLTVR